MTAIDEASASSSGKQVAPPPPPVKKKRSLPGMPDPNAEVIALSPTTLLATNRFVCEICNKGFQRDQNLQLHRRGHNLPWKLRQRSGKEARKRVYVCPEPSCAHHDPSRALGDLTGIKKHFCRKHGEKKWKCDRCSKKYAVLSDWKAHSKTCGTRKYRCDCGTLFSRRDSFITHRAFCDALAEESTKTHTDLAAANTVAEEPKMVVVPAASSPTSTVVANPVPNQQVARPEQQEVEARARILQYLPPPPPSVAVTNSGATTTTSSSNSTSGGGSTSLFACLFPSAGAGTTACHAATFSDLIGAMSRPVEPPSLPLSSNGPASLFFPPQIDRRQYAPSPPSPHMSATVLRQKAAEMGAAASNASLLRGFGHTSSITSSHQQSVQQDTSLQSEPPMLSAVLGLGLPYEIGATGLPELMMGPSSLFGPKPPTLDLLGLGMRHGSSATGGLSALITSTGSGLDMGAPSTGPFGGGSSPGKAWEVPERKPSSPAILL